MIGNQNSHLRTEGFMTYVNGRSENTEQTDNMADDVNPPSAPCNCGCSGNKKKAFPLLVVPFVIVLVLILIVYLITVPDGKN